MDATHCPFLKVIKFVFNYIQKKINNISTKTLYTEEKNIIKLNLL